MAQKRLKLLRVLDILKKTDEQHPITTNQIVSKLEKDGIEAERKSVLRDIKLLKEECGCEIELSQDNKLGYYMAARDFEDWEVRLLCDATAGARFLAEGDRRTLINKLCDLSSEAIGNQIKRTTFIQGRNSKKFETKRCIDTVMRAISAQKKIQFQYAEITSDLQEHLKWNGLKYSVSPYALTWKDNAYHLFGRYEGKQDLSVYRLDRMRNTEIINERVYPLREIYPNSPEEKLKEYIENSVYNYTGKQIYLTLKTQAPMLNAIRDQFGEIIRVNQCDDYIEVVVSTVESEGLYYWLLRYGKNITVVAPETVRQKMKKEYVEQVYRNYQ